MLTKEQFKAFRFDFSEAVKAVESKYGLKIQLGNIRYDDVKFTSRMTVTKLGENGSDQSVKNTSAAEEDFILYARMLDIPADWMNKTFTAKGHRLQIVGLNPRRPKNPIALLDLDDNKSYKCSASYVKAFIQ